CHAIKHASPKFGARTVHDRRFAKARGRERKNDARRQPHLLSGLEGNQIGAASSGTNQCNRLRAAQLVCNLPSDAADLIEGKPWFRRWFRIDPPAAHSDDCATVLSGRRGHLVTLSIA